MSKPTSVLLAASLFGALGVFVFSSSPGVANFSGGGGDAVALHPKSINAVIQPACVRGEPEIEAITNMPVQLPVDAGHAEPATRWTLRNLGAGNQKVCCRASRDGGVPEIACTASGIGHVAYPRERIVIEGLDLPHPVWCKLDSVDPEERLPVNVWEEACTQQ